MKWAQDNKDARYLCHQMTGHPQHFALPALEHLAMELLEGWSKLPEKWQTAPIGVGLSAGSDSCALAFACAHASRQAAGNGFFPEVKLLHIRHELRGEESHGDWLACQELAALLDLPLASMQASLPDGPDLEARARELRYKALRTLHPRGLLATGHHLQDQAETVLLRILRGAGALGLCGIAPLREDGVWRPFLRESPSTLRQCLREARWLAREDSSNQDTRFARNRLRHGLLPTWERQEPGLSQALADLASSAWALRPHLLARLEQIESLTASTVRPDGWSMDLSHWTHGADHPELDMVLERIWSRTGRRPWSRLHRLRLVEDVLARKAGTRRGGQGEIAHFGNGRLALEKDPTTSKNGRNPSEDGSLHP
jgi:tRNA(Ile)-lysidine synthetase-like protein